MNAQIRNHSHKYPYWIGRAGLILSLCVGMGGIPAIPAQALQPIAPPLLHVVGSGLPPASIGPIGTSFETATWLGITGPAYAPGQGIQGEGVDVDHYYVLMLPRGTGERTFRIVENGNLAQSLQLFDSAGNLLATGEEEVFLGYPQDREHLTYNFTEPDNYFLRVNRGSGSLNYYLTWDADGSSSSSALPVTSMSLEKSIEGFNDSRVNDWYVAWWYPGWKIRGTLDGASGSDFDLYVYDQSNLSIPIASSINYAYPDQVEFITQGTFNYYFRIHRNSGSGAYRLALVWVQEPAVPGNLTAFPDPFQPYITLNWTDNPSSGNETNFRVERSLNGTSGWAQIGTAAADQTSYIDYSPSECTMYYYRVRAYRSSDDTYSDYSNIASAKTSGCPLPAPSGLAATVISSSRINLTWTDNSADEDQFRVERSLNGSSSWTVLGSVGADITSYSNTGLSACTTYYYRVRAYRGSDATYSNYSNTASAKTTGCTSIRRSFLPLVIR